MQSESVHVIVEAPRTTVFDYVASVRNFPEWAAPFCRKLQQRGGAYFVTSPVGELAFEMASSPETGAVDVRFGPAHDRLATFPVRVVSLPDDRSLVVFTGWQLPGISVDEFAGQIEGMRRELGLLKEAIETRVVVRARQEAAETDASDEAVPAAETR